MGIIVTDANTTTINLTINVSTAETIAGAALPQEMDAFPATASIISRSRPAWHALRSVHPAKMRMNAENVPSAITFTKGFVTNVARAACIAKN